MQKEEGSFREWMRGPAKFGFSHGAPMLCEHPDTARRLELAVPSHLMPVHVIGVQSMRAVAGVLHGAAWECRRAQPYDQPANPSAPPTDHPRVATWCPLSAIKSRPMRLTADSGIMYSPFGGAT